MSHLAPYMRRVEYKMNTNYFANTTFQALHSIKKKIHAGNLFENRMLTANIDGSALYCFSSDVSHFDWLDEKMILAWAVVPSIGEGYYIFTDRSSQLRRVGQDVLVGDGHCSFFPEHGWILTDTYPNRNNMRRLVVYDLAKDHLFEIGSYYSIPNLHNEIRCDLHPRWSPDGTQVCFDSTHEGDRQIYVVDVGEIVQSVKT